MDDQQPTGDGKRPGGEMNSPRTGETTRSQLLPIGTNWSELARRPYFLPGAIVVVAVLLLAIFTGNSTATIKVMYRGVLPVEVPIYSVLLGAIISIGMAFAIYRLIGKKTAWWVMPAAAVFIGVLLMTPVIGIVQSLTGMDTGEIAKGDSLPIRFIKMFFAAGLPEELFKAIPVAIGVWLALQLKNPASPFGAFAVREPLDAILLGAAAGIGFAFVETVFQYVPSAIIGGDANAARILPKYLARILTDGPAVAAAAIQGMMPGRETALQLLIPRLLGGICGHAAWAGIFGYYIGLAFYKPANRAKTILIGLAIAASCHAAWNSIGGTFGMFGMLLVALFSFALLMAVIGKARELSPNRGALVSSQIVDSLSRIYPGGVKAGTVAATPAAAAFTSAAASNAATAPRQASAASLTWDDESNLLLLEIGTARIPATPGARVYERQAPGTESANSDNIVAEINANPSDPNVLGIKNLSKQSWQVTMATGEQRELATGRSIRLVRGTRIRIGDLVADIK
ncbi:MAG: PrsW family intramembrane metalloprotease [Betaproteobacteria bacterium]